MMRGQNVVTNAISYSTELHNGGGILKQNHVLPDLVTNLQIVELELCALTRRKVSECFHALGCPVVRYPELKQSCTGVCIVPVATSFKLPCRNNKDGARGHS